MLTVYAVTLMVSALLLFLVQPMFAKMVLPSLGGTPAVWNTCMVFFQAMLLAGYAYAHLGSRLFAPKRQAGIHVVLLALSLIALPIWPRYVDPGTDAPIPWLIGVLFVSLGVPFFMLAASAPLLQRWFAASGHVHARDPYFLYGASNLGSLAALIGYPLLVEPFLRLRQQSLAWSIGYDILVLLIAAAAWMLKRALGRNDAMPAPAAETALDDAPLTAARRGRWVALAFVPSSLLLGVTTYVTTDLAAVPLLWVVPLAIYLLTFVIVFARRPILKHGWMIRVQPFVLLPVVMLLLWNQKTMVWLMAPLHLLLFFACAMVCHGELAKDRPNARHLTEFYLWMSVGGVLGGMFNALVAPVVFDGVHEYPIAVVLACMLRPYLEDKPGPRARWLDLALPGAMAVALSIYAVKFAWTDTGPTPATMMVVSIAIGLLIYACRLRPIRFGLAIGAVLLASGLSADGPVPVLLTERSFFGVHKISLDEDGAYKLLTHGTTIHGAQATDPQDAKEPLTYYHLEGPLGQIFATLEEQLRGVHIAAVGLGSGAVTCYGEAGQTLTFFEIDPVVVAFASDRKYFSYVADCGAVRPSFVVGDARLTLSHQPDGRFGLLILDAFSSDAIPLHLVTKEAMQLYLAKLAPNGVIAFHISNRYLDLAPVLAAIVRELGLAARVSDESELDEEEGRAQMRYPATWVAIARQPAALGELWTASNWTELEERPGVAAWTDDFSNILSVLHFRTKGD